MFLRLELLDVWMEMEVAREQLRLFRSKSPRLKQMNEVPRSQRGCDRSTDGSSGKVLLPAVCPLCDDLGSPRILTKFREIPLSTALQFDPVSPLQTYCDDAPPQMLL